MLLQIYVLLLMHRAFDNADVYRNSKNIPVNGGQTSCVQFSGQDVSRAMRLRLLGLDQLSA